MRKIKLLIDSTGTVDIGRRVEREKMAEIQSDSGKKKKKEIFLGFSFKWPVEYSCHYHSYLVGQEVLR